MPEQAQKKMRMNAGHPQVPHSKLMRDLPEDLVQATHDHGALKYLTRGLTSTVYTYDLPSKGFADVRQHLKQLRASPTVIAIKCVDIDDQARPHDVAKEVALLTRVRDDAQSTEHRGQSLIVPLLHTSEDTPDDFTTLRRLYMPFYPSSLSQWLRDDADAEAANTPLSSDDRVDFANRLAVQLFLALDYLHSQGVYHRDVKPSNLLLTNAASDAKLINECEIRLCDYGTAWTSSSSRSQSSRPRTCSTSTHPYTPPELLFSPEDGYHGPSIDVWESVCTLSEIFAPIEVDPQSAEAMVHGATNDPFAPTQGLDFGGEADTSRSREASLDSDDIPEEMMLGAPSSDDPGAGADADAQVNWKREEARLFFGDLNGSNGNGRSRDDDMLGTRGIPKQSQRQAPRPPPVSHRRASFFNGAQGDLGLAADHFELLGVPEADRSDLWPEAVRFRPPLDRFPFKRIPLRSQEQLEDELKVKLPLLRAALEEQSGSTASGAQAFLDIVVGGLKLSAGQRWGTQQALDRLARCGQTQKADSR